MKKYFKITLLMSMAVLLAACSNEPVKVVHPHYGKISQRFTEPGKTHLDNFYFVNMPTSGELNRIALEPGDQVKQGQCVAQLDQIPLRQTLNQAQANVNRLQIALALQTKNVKRDNTLRKNGFVAPADLDNSTAKQKELFSQWQQAKAQLAIAKYNLSQSQLHSPITGTVLNRYTQGGKWIQVGTPLLRIGDLNQLQAIVDVLSEEAQQIKLGDAVTLTSSGSDVKLQGKVLRIYPAGFTKQSSLGVDEQRVDIVTSISKPQLARLGVGYRVQVDFLVDSDAHALLLPRYSVLEDAKGQAYVLKIVNKHLYKQPVVTGMSSDRTIAITKGVNTADVIVKEPTTEMRTGQKVNITS